MTSTRLDQLLQIPAELACNQTELYYFFVTKLGITLPTLGTTPTASAGGIWNF